jgi:hypothetical protein
MMKLITGILGNSCVNSIVSVDKYPEAVPPLTEHVIIIADIRLQLYNILLIVFETYYRW